MSFTSLSFVALFIVTYALYKILARNHKAQNRVLLLASYVFYGWWDWRFLALLAMQTAVDFYAAQAMSRAVDERHRKRWLWVSLGFNLAMLCFFKYFNFFADSATYLLNLMGFQSDPLLLRVVLPAGISFYTFQTMSYTIEVYKGEMEATDDLWDFAAFVAFFPHLVAGPIMRANVLLPQIQEPRSATPEQIDAGVFLILWGYFKKCVVADNVATIANAVFNQPTQHAGADLLLGALAFTVQIYADFSAYSDIARGISKLMGFELVINFRLPYFARTPSDFWQRWHISLSTWLRDYLYIPLGGNRGTTAATLRNLMVTMLLGGLWHGASWHFVAWGGYHGLLLILYRPFERFGSSPELDGGPRSGGRRAWAAVVGALQVAVMFGFTVVGWILFRAQSVQEAWYILAHLSLERSASTMSWAFTLAKVSWPLVLMQFYQGATADLLRAAKWNPWWRGLFYAFLITWMLIYTPRAVSEFIYFQF
ncbi:MAG: MBOAT family protein [Armatimonadetes bacterium]|nr:MBOAT family protein [Armatimonadota bacterium]